MLAGILARELRCTISFLSKRVVPSLLRHVNTLSYSMKRDAILLRFLEKKDTHIFFQS
jgi:hypothetical protein